MMLLSIVIGQIIVSGGAVACDGRIEPGDMILQVKRLKEMAVSEFDLKRFFSRLMISALKICQTMKLFGF